MSGKVGGYKRIIATVLSVCMVCFCLSAISVSAASEGRVLMNFHGEFSVNPGSDEYRQVQAPWQSGVASGYQAVAVATWSSSASSEGLSEFVMSEDNMSFTIKQHYYSMYGDNLELRGIRPDQVELNLDKPILVTMKYRVSAEDAEKAGEIQTKIRMRFNASINGEEQEINLETTPVSFGKSSDGLQTVQFYFDPTVGEFTSFLNGKGSSVSTFSTNVSDFRTAMIFPLAYTGDGSVNKVALPTPFSWTIESIRVEENVAKPEEIDEIIKTVKMNVDSNLEYAGGKVTDMGTSAFVEPRNWANGLDGAQAEASVSADRKQIIWKTVRESVNEDHIGIPSSSSGSWVTESRWHLRNDADLVVETKAKVQPETAGQGVRATLQFCAKDKNNVEVTNWVATSGDLTINADFHTYKLLISKKNNKCEFYVDDELKRTAAINADLSDGVMFRIYTATNNGGVVSGGGQTRELLKTPIVYTFEYFQVYELGSSGSGGEVIEPERPDPVERPIPASLKDRVIRTYPNGLMKAALMSYDDATDWNYVDDAKLLGILNKYNVRGTLNSITNQLNNQLDNYIELGLGTTHEFASHSAAHEKLDTVLIQPDVNAYMTNEAVSSRTKLENYMGEGNVRGWVTPYGYDVNVNGFYGIIRNAGYDYIRSISFAPTANPFDVPRNFLNWVPSMPFEGTDAHWTALEKLMADFEMLTPTTEFKLFFIWGHSHGFGKNVNNSGAERPEEAQTIAWGRLEQWAKYLQDNKETIWNPTCLEYVDYVDAVRQLIITDGGNGNIIVENPSKAVDCFLKIDGTLYEIEAGKTIGTKGMTVDYDYEPNCYNFHFDESITQSGGVCTEVGSLMAQSWGGHTLAQINSDGFMYKQNSFVHFVDALLLNSPAQEFDPSKPAILRLRYKVAVDDYNVDALPLARLALTNDQIKFSDGNPMLVNNAKTPSTGEVELFADEGNVWSTVEFVIDPVAKKVYVSNNGEKRIEYEFATDLTAEIMNNFRIYFAVRPSDYKIWQVEDKNNPVALSTPVTWTIDEIAMYQIETEDYLRVSSISSVRDENRISFSAVFKNYGTSAVNSIGLVALYNRNGVCQAVKSVDLFSLAGGQEMPISGVFDKVEANEQYYVKTFVWDSFSSLRPHDTKMVNVTE